MSRAASSQGSGKGPPKLCPFKKPHNSFGDILCTQFTDTQGLCRSLYLSTVNSFAMSISSLSFSFLGSLLYINRFPKEWNSVCLFPPCQTRNQNQFSILYRKKKKSKQTNKQTNLSCLIVIYRQVVSVVSGFFSFKRGGGGGKSVVQRWGARLVWPTEHSIYGRSEDFGGFGICDGEEVWDVHIRPKKSTRWGPYQLYMEVWEAL